MFVLSVTVFRGLVIETLGIKLTVLYVWVFFIKDLAYLIIIDDI